MIVYEVDEKSCVVAAIDPESMRDIISDNATIEEVARDARGRLEPAIAAL